MLVLGRKVNQRIFIGPDIIIQVVRVDKGYVHLGITAPPEIPIVREGVKVEKAKHG